jgi:2-C-methyl-D-erythritol 4-phosphate cytidylyltransferase
MAKPNLPHRPELAVVIMAAGKGTRLKSKHAKVLRRANRRIFPAMRCR